MGIDFLKYGSYFVGNSAAGYTNNDNKAKDEKPAETTQINNVKEINAEDLLGAMDIVSSQNKANIHRWSPEDINPADYLSDERVSDIEAMMDEFENGVGQVADVIEDEFPNLFTDEQKMTLAANIFAREA